MKKQKKNETKRENTQSQFIHGQALNILQWKQISKRKK